MATQSDFTIGLINSDLIPNYGSKKFYHPCLIFKPKELVLIYPAIYSKEQQGNGTAKKYLKVLQRFCQWYQGQIQSKHNLDQCIAQFERLVTVSDLERWMSHRELNRIGMSPTDAHIEQDAKDVARFLDWAKVRLKRLGVIVAFEGAYKVKKLVNLRITDMYKGMQGPIEVEIVDFRSALKRKPALGENPRKHARIRQRTMGHNYLTAEELGIFFDSFADDLYRFICMTGYHTGLRPSEVLSIPRFIMYDRTHNGLNYFTSDPVTLGSLMAKGHKHIYLWVEGKGSKLRKVKFVIKQWQAIMYAYENTIFRDRRELWKKLNCKDLPLDYLWLARPLKSSGYPKIVHCLLGDTFHYDTYQKPLWGAIAQARKKHNLVERFGHSVDYYCLRHSFATNYLVVNINAEKNRCERGSLPLKTSESIIFDLNLKSQLMEQLGHSDFSITWERYVHNVEVLGSLELPDVLDLLRNV